MKEIGTVKVFSALKGKGAICREDGSEIPVHVSSILPNGRTLRTLKAGQRVEFEVDEDGVALEVEIL